MHAVVGALQADGAVGVKVKRAPAGGQGRALGGVLREGIAPGVNQRGSQRVALDVAHFA